jgi:hypothetical protein
MSNHDKAVAYYEGYFSKQADNRSIKDTLSNYINKAKPAIQPVFDFVDRNSQTLKKAIPAAVAGAATGGLGSVVSDAASGDPVSARKAALLAILGGAGGGAYGAMTDAPIFRHGYDEISCRRCGNESSLVNNIKNGLI